jgi:hypothetical protein
MNSANMTTKLFTVSITAIIILSVMMIVTTFLPSNMPVQKVSAQMMAQQPPSEGTMGPGMMGMMNPNMMGPMMRNQNFTGMMNSMMGAAPNVTGSVPIFPTIINAISSKVHTGLGNATMTAEKTVGSNAHAVSADLGVQNGFLVYTISLIDSSNNFHRVIVDVGNGNVLASKQIPIGEMMRAAGMMMGQQSMGMMGSHPPQPP